MLVGIWTVLSAYARQKSTVALMAVGLWAVCGRPLLADNVLHIVTPPNTAQVDRPTLYCLGVKMPFSGDDDLDSSVRVEYQVLTNPPSLPWKRALDLWRVHPEVVTGETLTLNYAGSIFDQKANTTYNIRLTISDPDGIVDQNNVLLVPLGQPFVALMRVQTRAVPGDPASPNPPINVTTAAQLTSALASARPGDIITVAPGTYNGSFAISTSGAADNPIVIRGANRIDNSGNYVDQTFLNGNCNSCNVLNVYGSYTHVEWLTLQNAPGALRSVNPTTGNVYRRLHTLNTDYGLFSANSGGAQTDFYFADNILEGRIAWPKTCLTNKSCKFSSVNGIGIWGHGHVVAHNRISGFGDAIMNRMTGARSNDFYGNDVLWNYDDATELDYSEGNVRYFRNRISNTFEGVSLQPIYGGPAYVFRNIGINIQMEQLKMHNGASGYLVYNNTFVSNSFGHAWNNQTTATCHYFVIENNLFQGPVPLTANEADVTCNQDHAIINYNGYSTDGQFAFKLNGTYTRFGNFAWLQSLSPLEDNGQILTTVCSNGSVFSSCLLPPADNQTLVLPPPDVTPGSPISGSAIDSALLLPNVNDQFRGKGPDVGAVEVGCVQPIYGPRPVGLDENKIYTCSGYQ